MMITEINSIPPDLWLYLIELDKEKLFPKKSLRLPKEALIHDPTQRNIPK